MPIDRVVGSFETAEIIKTDRREALEAAQARQEVRQVASGKALLEESESNPAVAAMRMSRLRRPEKPKTERAERAGLSVLVRKEDADDLADNFTKKDGNKQYRLDRDQLSLLAQSLGEQIKGDTTEEAIIQHLQVNLAMGGRLPDPGQVDKTFDFLLEVLQGRIDSATEPEVKEKLQSIFNRVASAKARHFNEHQREVETAHTYIDLADTIVEQGHVETPEALSHIRSLIDNPTDLLARFSYYQSNGYTFRDIKKEIDAILAFLGKEFKRHEIPTAEMDAMMKETKRAQAILQIFRHFKKGSALAERLFAMQGLSPPPNFSFQTLGIDFMNMVGDRHPSDQSLLGHIKNLTG